MNHFATGKGPLVPTQPDEPILNPFELQLCDLYVSNKYEYTHGPCIRCLPDDRVYEILTRYQGSRVLEDEWLTRELKSSDLLPVNHSTNEDEFKRMYSLLMERHTEFGDGHIPARSSAEAKSYTSFNRDRRGRFYAALTSV